MGELAIRALRAVVHLGIVYVCEFGVVTITPQGGFRRFRIAKPALLLRRGN